MYRGEEGRQREGDQERERGGEKSLKYFQLEAFKQCLACEVLYGRIKEKDVTQHVDRSAGICRAYCERESRDLRDSRPKAFCNSARGLSLWIPT